MATTFTLQSTSYDGRYLKLTCSQTKNVAANTSTITWKLESLGGTYNYYSTGPTTLTIGGTQVYSSSRAYDTFPGSKGSTSGTLTVNHNADGSKSLAITLTTAIYYKAQSSVSGTWALDSNPRKATITAAPNFNDEEDPTVSFSNPAGNSATKLEIGISANGTDLTVGYKTITDKTGTSYTFSLTDAERTALRNSITTGHSRTVSFILRTTIGSYIDTHKVNKTLSLINYTPVVSVSVVDSNATTTALTGNSSKFIRGQSHAAYTITAAARKGASVASYWCNGVETTASNTEWYVSANTIEFIVKDTRGNQTTVNQPLDMIEYVPVSCSQKVSVEMSGETTAKVDITVEGSYFNQSFGSQSNALTIQVFTKQQDGDWGPPITIQATPTFSGNTFRVSETLTTTLDYRTTMIYDTKVFDKLTIAYSGEYISKVIPVFDWSDTDFNFNVPISFNNVPMMDYIVEQGTKTTGSGNSTANWVYRKWNSGVAECWCRKHVSTAVNTAWGNLFVSGALSYTNITWGVSFIDVPVANITIAPNNSGAFLIAGGSTSLTATNTGGYEIARGSALASAGNFYINYYAIGKWK